MTNTTDHINKIRGRLEDNLPSNPLDSLTAEERDACWLEAKIDAENSKIWDKHEKNKKGVLQEDPDEYSHIVAKKLASAMKTNPEHKEKLIMQLNIMKESGVDENAFVKGAAAQRFVGNETRKLLVHKLEDNLTPTRGGRP